ncbi:MAG: AlkA N-terminal domain-containing protein [Gammaproteobacteria bacterium]|jgi:AraC family transcriptional regulator of adaptative response / DNA-3-methyladenine glycosylase II
MNLRDDDCYLALKARDVRFDGQFFTCVTSTGIYCRPVCPARTPKRANCTFVASAAAAEDAGYRPCLRCRPEAAPGSPEWLGSESTVHRALRIIDESTAHELSLDDVSRELGISARQLRRLFAESLGTSPKSVLQTKRIQLARQLLVETSLPLAQVAMAAGFGSIRRFNSAVRKSFDMTPSSLRRRHGSSRGKPASGGAVRLHLDYRPPFAWEPLLAHFSSRGIHRLEAANGTYIRCVRVGEARGRVRITHEPERHRVCVAFLLDRNVDLTQAASRVRDLLDLDASPQAIAAHLGRDARLRSIVNANPGLRFPGAWSVFEMLVRAIVGQQVSVPAARTVLGRIVEALGEPVTAADPEPALPDRLFPEPEALAGESMQPFGLNTARAETLNRVAAEFAADPRFVHAGMPAEVARKRLLALRGIGPWTAEYVILRALRYPDAFPAADLGGMKAAGVDKPRDLAALAESWRPWRGYALLYLWKSLEPKI